MKGRAAVAAGLLLVACAAWAPPEGSGEPPARIAVEILPGFAQRPPAPESVAERVEILLDLTTSMRAATPEGPARFAAAREAAVGLLEALPERLLVGVRGLGLAAGAACVEPTPLWMPASKTGSREALVSHLRAIQPNSEGSLAAALEQLQGDLAAELARTRVVLLTDLGAECGGDLCAAGAALVAAGARLEFVLLGDAELPECFLGLAPGGPPRLAALDAPLPTPSFRLESHTTGSTEPGLLLGVGQADGQPLSVPAGSVTLILEMEPPAIIGPMLLSPDTLTHVRVVDFPGLEPHLREWRWDPEPTAAEDSEAAAEDAEGQGGAP